jgi:hypothetical protein
MKRIFFTIIMANLISLNWVQAQTEVATAHPARSATASKWVKEKKIKNIYSPSSTNATQARFTEDTYYIPIAVTKSTYSTSTSSYTPTDSISFGWYKDKGKNVNLLDYDGLVKLSNEEENDVKYLESLPYRNTEILEFTVLPHFDTMRIDDLDNSYRTQIVFQYNANNQQVSWEQDNNGVLLQFEYTPTGLLYKTSVTFNSFEFTTDSATYNLSDQKTGHYKLEDGIVVASNEYVYDNNGKLLVLTYNEFDNNNAFTERSVDSIFTLTSTTDSIVNYWYDALNDTYESDEYFIVHHSNGLYDSVMVVTPSIGDDEKFVYTRNNNGALTLLEYYEDNILEGKMEVAYNNASKIVHQFVGSWTGTGWDLNSRQEYTYDMDGKLTRYNTYEHYDDNTNTWIADDDDMQSQIYYELYEPNNIQTLQRAHVTVFPNPTQDKITLTIAENAIVAATVYDAMGRVVIVQEFLSKNNEQGIDVSLLPAGNYTVQIKTDNGVGTTQFVKK